MGGQCETQDLTWHIYRVLLWVVTASFADTVSLSGVVRDFPTLMLIFRTEQALTQVRLNWNSMNRGALS